MNDFCRGDLVQLDVTITGAAEIATVWLIDPDDDTLEVVMVRHGFMNVHYSRVVRVGRAKFWPSGEPIVDNEIADTIWGRIPIAS